MIIYRYKSHENHKMPKPLWLAFEKFTYALNVWLHLRKKSEYCDILKPDKSLVNDFYFFCCRHMRALLQQQ